ncbi:MAG: hypothetical protein Q8K65_02645 [Alphaproteobacteria bacterium]|nr:hypothetical protein [Alphaproteobacteria bacterium]
MAEAGQKDQTGNEAVAIDNETPKSLDEVTGFSNGNAPVETKPTPDKPRTSAPESTAPVTGEPATPAEKSDAGSPKINSPEDSAGKPAVEADKDALKKTKAIDNDWQDMLLRRAWNMDEIDPEIGKVVKGVQQDEKSGAISFKTDHGNFEWGKAKDGSEYIGRRGFFNTLTQDIADDEALVAKSRGWKVVEVHGSESNKEKLWLGAMRAGLEVANYAPPENSRALEAWKKECADKLTGLKNAEEAPANAAPKQDQAATPKVDEPEPAKNDAAETPAAATPTDAAPVVEEPKAAAPISTKFGAVEPPKNDAVETPAAAAPTDTAPVVEEPKAAEPPKNDAAETPVAAAATDTAPVVEDPKAAEPPKAEAPATPVSTKFGAVEPPKAEEPKASEPPKANPAHAQWEKDKALFSSKPEGHEVSPEGRKNVEAVEGMSKRAAEAQDPTHRAGIEKLQDAIKSGKVSVNDEIEREIINNVDSPKGFQKAADYFGKKAGSDLGLPKVDAPAAAENAAPQNKAPKNKGPA